MKNSEENNLNNISLPPIAQDIWETMKTIKRENCGSEFFVERMIFKEIPGPLIGSRDSQVQPFNVIICANCKSIPNSLDRDHKLRNIIYGNNNEDTNLKNNSNLII